MSGASGAGAPGTAGSPGTVTSIEPARARSEARDAAWRAAAAVPDPEVPCVTVEDLGILVGVDVERARDDRGDGDGDGDGEKDGDWVATARVTPTYSGCPAVLEIERMVGEALADAGFEPRVERVLSPAWTTDRITADGRAKLKAFGIAPPTCVAGDADGPDGPGGTAGAPRARGDGPATVTFFSRAAPACPRCGSTRTEMLSEFGSTACKAHHRCLACREPFDHFKPL